ncbi:NYN domain-containing protein [Kribbella albertanoniae]|uniref:NYN domain-containing protein n=1 Tax=Kribbella albertanoniae TaxID=1266829 RepID=A0A4R4PNM9_9ACTN|nr:NYN domain-containing protein [Kribbella albertanoniae]TDC23820.1 NYN domain-containing protein [Kribbella albertanoniae]
MRKNWPILVGCTTALWSFVYGVAGLYWSLGGAHYPFARVEDDRSTASVLEGAPVAVVGPMMAILGLGGAVLAVVMTVRRPRGWLLQTIAAVLAVGLALVIPDYTLIAIVALSPALVVFAFTGVPGEQGGVGDILYWHRLNLLILFVGGVLWAGTAIAYHRRTRAACVSCGRSDRPAPAWTTPESALRWGRVAVGVSVVANLPYEATRIAWYFGWPLGITGDFHQMMADTPGMLEMGLGLAVLAIGGSVLTHGLVQRWGEVYPRWIWFKAGRRVPPRLAIIPASIVAVALFPAGLMNAQLPLDGDNWALNAPGILWILWGAALGAATYAYYLRRRTACVRCGRGVRRRSDALAGSNS